jgi:hypothetical protein
MLKLQPPQNHIDDLAEWIDPRDPAWDNDRVEAEREKLADHAEAGLAEDASDEDRKTARKKACDKHPISVWYTGACAYSHDAPLTVPEALRQDGEPATVTIRDYLTGTPTCFVLRNLDARSFARAMKTATDKDKDWNMELVRRGLVKITGVEGPDGEETELVPERKNGLITWPWMDALSRADRHLFTKLGGAIYAFNEGSGARGKL